LAGMPASTDIGRRHGAAGFVLRIDGIGFELYFDAPLCDALAPPDRPPARALETRRSAILPVDATFTVTLDLGHASIAESLALRPGEVIRTSIPVDAQIRVRGASGEAVLSGTLAAANGQRAIRISHSP
jgi:Type III flagellar switch regulator (C-ring) FliN C-term